jgi:hypothetical protein
MLGQWERLPEANLTPVLQEHDCPSGKLAADLPPDVEFYRVLGSSRLETPQKRPSGK